MPDVHSFSESFPQGFVEGWRFVMGLNAEPPQIPHAELIEGKTPYQSGLAKGVEVGVNAKQHVQDATYRVHH